MLEKELDDMLEKENIELVRDRIPHGFAAGYARGAAGKGVIVIDPAISDTREVNAHLCHELGHHYTTAPNLFGAPAWLFDLCETLADRRANDICMNLGKLIAAYRKGCRRAWEFSEELGIPEKRFTQGVDILRMQYGEACEYDGWRVSFCPLRIERAGGVV